MTDSIELANAIAAVKAVDVADGDQAALQERIISFCKDHPDALHRSCLSGHLTGSALIVDSGGEAVLLIHHAKLERWLQPGGHVDGEGDLAAAACREAEEETGISGLEVIRPAIDLDIHSIPERGDEPTHLHLDVRYLVIAPPGAKVDINHESLDSRWVTSDDPENLIGSEELRRLVDIGLRQARALSRRRSG